MVLSNLPDAAGDAVPSLPDWTDLWQETFHWVPTSHQLQQFQTLYQLILAGNRQLNLTRITDPLEFAEKHLWDSLSGIQTVMADRPAGSTASPYAAIDIGTGAGFPGIPIAIAQPNWRMTLLDSTRKKMTFLDQLLQALDLSNASTLVARVEEIGQQRQHRNHYDLALIRAVASASVCAEYALPLLKMGGQAVLYRGQWTEAEAAALEVAATTLGGKVEAIAAFKTPITQSDRHCITLRKVAQTPSQYPRPTGIPTQKPLGMPETQG